MTGERDTGAQEHGLLAQSKRDPEIFADFYAALAPSTLRFFARETHEAHRAFDLVAETFAVAFERRADFKGETDEQAAAWLWTIARSQLARFRRSRTIELNGLARLRLERPAPVQDELQLVERLAAAANLQDQVRAALDILPVEQRVVVELRFLRHLSYQDIAAHLGVSNDVVRARCSRALRLLRSNDQLHSALQSLEPWFDG